MPWSVRDVDNFKRGLTPAQKQQWVAIANSVLRQCLAGGRSESYCDQKAIRTANSQVG